MLCEELNFYSRPPGAHARVGTVTSQRVCVHACANADPKEGPDVGRAEREGSKALGEDGKNPGRLLGSEGVTPRIRTHEHGVWRGCSPLKDT